MTLRPLRPERSASTNFAMLPSNRYWISKISPNLQPPLVMVPAQGLEPRQPCGRPGLNGVRLPIPPRGHHDQRTGREERIRTSGPHVPNVVLYQAELLPDCVLQLPKNMLVGETGFEPAALRSQSGCATGLRYSPRPALNRLVGTTGFEPATPCPPDKCATRLRHVPTIGKLEKPLPECNRPKRRKPRRP